MSPGRFRARVLGFSRVYYAAFLVASAYLDRIGFAVENTPHVAVQYALNNCGDADLQSVGTELRSLSSDRRRADYDVRDKMPERLDHATNAVNRAANAIAKLDEVRDNAPADRTGAIAVALSNWLKSAQTAGLRQKSGTS